MNSVELVTNTVHKLNKTIVQTHIWNTALTATQ